jgi:NAD+ synthase (glutamine-hydrolysing)
MESKKAAVLPPDLQKQLQVVRAKRAFDPATWVDRKTDMLNDYMRQNGLKACLVAVSGGVDSAVVYALMMTASKKDGSPIQKTLGVAQPIHSTESIWKRALLLTDLGGEIITVDQSQAFDTVRELVDKAAGIEGNAFSAGQLKSYMRTPVNYYLAQLVSQSGAPCIVLGTGNKDEDGYLCYFCKAGDGVVDVQLIADLHKSEVFAVGRYLNVHQTILDAPPSADLWPGQTDEDELGFTYDFVELLTEYLAMNEEEQTKMREAVSEESWAWFTETARKAEAIHRRNKHKLHFPVNLNLL